jgi:serine/threonine protein kinase/tetratricopeptide (TPR) repeat protein
MRVDIPQAREIFLNAVESHSPEQWPGYLDEACAGDPDLRQRVEALLRAHCATAGIVDQMAQDPDCTGDFALSEEGPGTVIGPYKLLQEIGEGGMGAVFMAEQEHPLRRRVALKIIKPGMDTKQVIARFEAERQALALMDHQNIARVLDAGTTEAGRPFFVMELVKGIPITDYCDQNHLTPQERLELFVPVCQAIQHAHQKGIIHRDLKPSNILITLRDGKPVPKVIDFGIAKAIDQRLTERTLFTQFGAVIGTPEYMSPEQAQMGGLDIDTRSDIYSLGVLLYELLTGSTPLRRETLRDAAFGEMLRRIKEEEPPKPSTRLSASTETLPSIAAQRHTEPARLARMVRGELDWIVMKCLEKDRTRRYDTANGLAADLRRHLGHEPVEAGPPSAWYRLRKFGRRNRVALATAAVVSIALVAGTAVSTWEAIRATRAEREADRRGAEAREVVDFLINDMIGAASPSRTQGKMPTVDKVLAQADQNIGQKFADRPLIEASIRKALGEAYLELGQVAKAEEHAGRAVELRLAHLGPDHVDTIAAQNALGWALVWRGYSGLPRKAEETRILSTRVLATARKALGPEHKETLRSMHILAFALFNQDKLDEARALNEECLTICKRVLGPEDPETLNLMHELADLWRGRGEFERAKELGEQTLAIEKRVHPDLPNQYATMSLLARSYTFLGQSDRALEMRRLAMDGVVRIYGLASRFTRESIESYLCSALTEGTHWERARDDLGQLLDRLRREPGPEAKLTWCVTAMGLALLLRDHGRLAEARPLLEQSLAEALRLGKERPQWEPQIEKFAQFLLGRWPGLAPGIEPAQRPPASFTIEAPFRAVSPVADGRIDPGEYGPGVAATFDDATNPGRLGPGSQSRSKSPDDLSVQIHTAYTDRSLFLAFHVRDQSVDANESDAKVPWLNDCVQVYINGDHVANDMSPGFLAQPWGNREGFQLVADAAGHPFTAATGFTSADWKARASRTDDGYIVEVEIPLALIDTRDGPEYVPAAGGSELLVNFKFTDNDAPVSAQTDVGIFWAEDPVLEPYDGEDLWTVSLRLVPKPAGP